MNIELIYTENCPHYKEALRILRDTLRETGSLEKIRKVPISTQTESEAIRFPGSPTIRINGNDVDPKFVDNGDYSFCCRVYYFDERVWPYPPKDIIRQSIMKGSISSRKELKNESL